MQALLVSNNVGFSAKDMEHGRQFRFPDGAIANVYNSGKIIWQGKRTETPERVSSLCGLDSAPSAPGPVAVQETTNLANNKVFIVYGHDVEAREQLELLLRRMKLEPVILQNLPIAGDTIIEKLEQNMDVRYPCVLLTQTTKAIRLVKAKRRSSAPGKMWCWSSECFWSVSAGNERAILHKGNLELPSDISGLIYIKFNKRVDEVKERLGHGSN